MKEYEGKKVKLTVEREGKELFYCANVLKVTDTHISFLDKFGIRYTFRISDVVQINEVNGE